MNIDPSTKEEQAFPGYPHYSSKEDIMNEKNNERVSLNVENLSRSQNAIEPNPDKSVDHKEKDSPFINEEVEDNDDEETTNANLTADDLIALGDDDVSAPKDHMLDGDDLDIPGAEDDDDNEDIGEEDEENNYYSIGGDAHENLDEDRGTE